MPIRDMTTRELMMAFVSSGWLGRAVWLEAVWVDFLADHPGIVGKDGPDYDETYWRRLLLQKAMFRLNGWMDLQ